MFKFSRRPQVPVTPVRNLGVGSTSQRRLAELAKVLSDRQITNNTPGLIPLQQFSTPEQDRQAQIAYQQMQQQQQLANSVGRLPTTTQLPSGQSELAQQLAQQALDGLKQAPQPLSPTTLQTPIEMMELQNRLGGLTQAELQRLYGQTRLLNSGITQGDPAVTGLYPSLAQTGAQGGLSATPQMPSPVPSVGFPATPQMPSPIPSAGFPATPQMPSPVPSVGFPATPQMPSPIGGGIGGLPGSQSVMSGQFPVTGQAAQTPTNTSPMNTQNTTATNSTGGGGGGGGLF